jgi:hypothetical protein
VLRITVPTDVQAVLRNALTKAGSRECGGLLLGEHVGIDHFVVRNLTVQKPGAIASFVRSLSGALSAVTSFCRANGGNFTKFNYLGEWHSHPLFSVQPSAQDHSTMRDLATDKSVGANFVVLLIFRMGSHGLEGSAHTYLPNGNIHQSKLELEMCQ